MATSRIPPIQCLLTFEAVSRLRSASRAAAELCVTVSAISHRIRQLESHLGIRLFSRGDFTLTSEGALFLARCRKILAEVEAAEFELCDSASQPHGKLRISLPQVHGLVMPVMTEFMALYPQIELDLDLTDRMVDVVEEGFDAVIRTGKRAVVYVVDGPGKYHPVQVQLGAEIDDRLVVQGGLAAGQQVVA